MKHLSKADILFNYILDAPFDTPINLPMGNKEKYTQGVYEIKRWILNGFFAHNGCCVAFDEEFKSITKYRLVNYPPTQSDEWVSRSNKMNILQSSSTKQNSLFGDSF